MKYKVDDWVIFKEIKVPLGQCTVAAGSRAQVQCLNPPYYWVCLESGGLVRVTDEHVEGEGVEGEKSNTSTRMAHLAESTE